MCQEVFTSATENSPMNACTVVECPLNLADLFCEKEGRDFEKEDKLCLVEARGLCAKILTINP